MSGMFVFMILCLHLGSTWLGFKSPVVLTSCLLREQLQVQTMPPYPQILLKQKLAGKTQFLDKFHETTQEIS